MEVIIDGTRYVPVREHMHCKRPFNQLIKEARKNKQESLDAASKNMGTNKSYLWELEQGRSSPTLTMLVKIIRYYNINFYEIE